MASGERDKREINEAEKAWITEKALEEDGAFIGAGSPSVLPCPFCCDPEDGWKYKPCPHCGSGVAIADDMESTFGNGGFITFKTQLEAETFLVGLPFPYAGSTMRIATGWAVTYRKSVELEATNGER